MQVDNSSVNFILIKHRRQGFSVNSIEEDPRGGWLDPRGDLRHYRGTLFQQHSLLTQLLIIPFPFHSIIPFPHMVISHMGLVPSLPLVGVLCAHRLATSLLARLHHSLLSKQAQPITYQAIQMANSSSTCMPTIFRTNAIQVSHIEFIKANPLKLYHKHYDSITQPAHIACKEISISFSSISPGHIKPNMHHTLRPRLTLGYMHTQTTKCMS